jgi:hypothetical protein
MITIHEAKQLNYGDILVDLQGNKWRVNGQVRTWKTDPTRIRVPLKHGLYDYDALDTADFNGAGECMTLTRQAVIEAHRNRYNKPKE